jgi:hypothetical protein
LHHEPAGTAAGGSFSGLHSGSLCQLVVLTAEGRVQLLSVLQLSPLEEQAAAAAAAGQWDCGARFGSSIRLLRSSELQLQQGHTAGAPPAAWGHGLSEQELGLAGGRQVGSTSLAVLLLMGWAPART